MCSEFNVLTSPTVSKAWPVSRTKRFHSAKADKKKISFLCVYWLKTKHGSHLKKFQCWECQGQEGRVKMQAALTTGAITQRLLNAIVQHCALECSQVFLHLPWFQHTGHSLPSQMSASKTQHTCLELSIWNHLCASHVISSCFGKAMNEESTSPWQGLASRGGGEEVGRRS